LHWLNFLLLPHILRRAVCGVRCAPCGVRRAACGVIYAGLCRIPDAGYLLPVVNPSKQRYDYFYSHANILQEK
jgi:hypothetical protein